MRARYQTLDAMRGFAAVTVVLYHTIGLYGAPCTVAQPCHVPFGYLAVDLFFVLSGFVIAHSYDGKLAAGMSIWEFMTARLKRLLPIYLVGLVLGLTLPLRDALAGIGGGKHALLSAGTNVAMLPAYSWSSRPVPFPLDPPAWSLFFELWIANLLYASAHRLLHGRMLVALIGISFVGLLVAQAHFGTLDMGSFWTDFVGGFPRVLFSFFVGVALCRFRDRWTSPAVPAWVVLAAVVGSFCLPLSGAAARVYEIVAVIVLYPTLVVAGATAAERRPWLGKALGELSYALYAIHIPAVLIAFVVLARFGVAYSPVVLVAYLTIVLVASAVIAKADLVLQGRLRASQATARTHGRFRSRRRTSHPTV